MCRVPRDQPLLYGAVCMRQNKMRFKTPTLYATQLKIRTEIVLGPSVDAITMATRDIRGLFNIHFPCVGFIISA